MARQVLAVRLEPHHKDAVTKAAKAKHMTLSEYCRVVLIKAAKADMERGI